jgi:hypothetical protein
LSTRQRRSQLVRGVHGKPPDVREGRLEPGEHRVQGLGQVIQLVGRPAERQALGQVLRADPSRRARHRLHRPERGAGEPGAPDQRQPEAQRHHDRERLHIAGQRPIDVGEGRADLDEPRRLLRDRNREQPHALPAG